MPYNPYLKDGKPTRRLSVVAFFDILGYENQTREAYKNGFEECFFNKLCNALNKSYEFLEFQDLGDLDIDLPYVWKAFTDNIVMGYPLSGASFDDSKWSYPLSDDLSDNSKKWTIDSHLFSIVRCIALFQLNMVLSGFFLRGAIEIGDFCMTEKNQIVFGLGLIEAYRAEEKLACNPRVVLPNRKMSDILLNRKVTSCYAQAIRDSPLSAVYLFKDADKHVVLNYLYVAYEYEERLLFSTQSQTNDTNILDNGNVPDDLQQAFEEHAITLSQNVMVSSRKTVNEWLMTDKENNQVYVVRWLHVNVVKQDYPVRKDELRIYEKTFGGSFEETLCKHKKIVEEILEKHDQDYKLLKKYVWVANYHNHFCYWHYGGDFYRKLEIDLSKYPQKDCFGELHFYTDASAVVR